MRFRYCCPFIGVACLIGVIALTGCRKDKAPAPAPTAESNENAHAGDEAGENPQVIAMLAKADLVDGAEDGVVHRCPGCRLGMDGDETHQLTVGKYRMHFCSPGCKDRFGKDVTKNVLALAIPEGD